MVLLSPVGLGVPPASAFIDGLIAAKNRQQMSAVLTMLLADESLVSRDMVNDMLKYTRIDGVAAALRQFAEFLPHENGVMVNTLANVTSPIHIFWGEQDRIVPVPPASEIPGNAHLTVLANVGHMPHLESSSQTVELIEKVLAI
jgi:pyruvate dehydrogenase E2 component (dihydrolipoamide acetyltransferase)